MSRLVLGLNTDHADTSATLADEHGVLAAIAEERLVRKKHSAAFPTNAIAEVLRIASATIQDVTDIAVPRDPRANLARKVAFVARDPRYGLPLAVESLRVHRKMISTTHRIANGLGVRESDVRAQLHHVEHHLAHTASAFFCSPFERASGLTHDGAGDFATTMWTDCQASEIRVLRRTHWPHSPGIFYTALSQFIGFEKYGEEYKVMGLSAYGENRYPRIMREMMWHHPVFGLRLGLDYFRHHRLSSPPESIDNSEVTIPRLWSDRLIREFGPARRRDEPIGVREQDIAASMQVRFEEVFLTAVAELVRKTGVRRIVVAGGSALNAVANGRMLAEGYADDAYFQPAASDDGSAIGAALYVLHGRHGVPRAGELRNAFLGTQWTPEAIEVALMRNGRRFERLGPDQLIDTAARAIADAKIVGWFQGREEWGPRALGNRSILCNPAIPEMKSTLNARIKHREPFRPFAPVCRREDLSTVFEGTHAAPFMIVVYRVRPEWRSRLPATTHEDGTSRVQTVTSDENHILYDLISRFREITGIPVLLNTSFNENEPIVHTPEQAIACFERTKMDALGIGPFWITKE